MGTSKVKHDSRLHEASSQWLCMAETCAGRRYLNRQAGRSKSVCGQLVRAPQFEPSFVVCVPTIEPNKMKRIPTELSPSPRVVLAEFMAILFTSAVTAYLSHHD